MEYATDILKCLLLRLVDKSVISKHPQLMLRRTESVVEKMLTNYMAICMYDYLKEYAGSSLFLLFKAIKHQIEKGLVDAITHDARYSISEERLLHEQISHSVVVLHIVQDDLDEKIQCKVLDWDTISQVKSKILDALFKNTPFSMRPTIHEVDLEWRHGRGGHLILQDEDLTTKTTNGWRRLNTLAHYGVKESAVMSLVARQNDSYNLQYSNKLQPPYNNCMLINFAYFVTRARHGVSESYKGMELMGLFPITAAEVSSTALCSFEHSPGVSSTTQHPNPYSDALEVLKYRDCMTFSLFYSAVPLVLQSFESSYKVPSSRSGLNTFFGALCAPQSD
uniref:Plexin cytoplasmic RhoGTPase-binding domain-containing protein n=1 Tax=Glossina austeni TaxID=7395 RepID=A0A1A9VMA1_GLOAU